MALTRTVTLSRNPRGVATGLRVPVCKLEVLEGPDKGLLKADSLERMVVGSGETAHFRLTDNSVSALHFEIVQSENGIRLKDLGSKNGIYLGGHRVFEATLNDSDSIRIGVSLLRFEVLDQVDEKPLDTRTSLGRLRGSSVRMRQLYGELLRVAASDNAVLLHGATGTGKELAAEAIVAHSQRNAEPFEVIDCPALASAVAESELFGHEAGSFSGATQMRRGAFERANHGTLLLDEIGELNIDLQAKLLGAIERKEVQRVGGTKPIPVDVRIISTTQRDLERDVNAGRFRQDLYFRLAVLPVYVPSLEEHREDLPELIAHILSELPEHPRLKPTDIQELVNRNYPGNVFELKASVERLALGLKLKPDMGLETLRVDTEQPFHTQRDMMVTRFETQYISALLEECKGNVTELSRRSGLNRTHLYRIMSRLNLKR